MSSSRTVEREKLLVLARTSNSLSLSRGILGARRTRALDVADDGAALVVHELDADLGDTTTRAYSQR